MTFLKPLAVLTVALVLYQSLFTTVSGENVVTVSNEVPCRNGENHTVTCKMEKRTTLVKWMKGKDAILYSYKDSCKLNPKYVGKYNVSCDPTHNIFNLTILNVTEDNNGEKLVCSNGIDKACKLVHVGDEEQSLEEETVEQKTVTGKSACCDKEVSFKWIKIDPISSKEEEFKPKILERNYTYCPEKECVKNGTKYHTEKISISPTGNGTKYYLKMAVVYGNERIESKRTTHAYIIEDQAEIYTKSGQFEDKHNKDNLAVVIAVTSAAAVAAVVVAVIFWRKRAFNSCKHEEPKEEMKPFLNPDHDFYREVLNRSHKRFYNELDTTPLLDLFLEKEFLQFSQVRDIQEMKQPAEQTSEISKIVMSKGVEGYEIYKRLLRESKQEHLADYLEQKESELEKDLMVEKEKEHKRQHDKEEFTIENEKELETEITIEIGKEHKEKAELETEITIDIGKEHKKKAELEKELMVEKGKEHKEKAELEKELMVEKEKEHKEKAELEKELMIEKEKEHKEKAELEKEFTIEKGKEHEEKAELEKELMVEKEKEQKEKHDPKASRQTRTAASKKDLCDISQCFDSDWEMLAPFLFFPGNSSGIVKQIKDQREEHQQSVLKLLQIWFSQTDDPSLAHLLNLVNKARSSVTIKWQVIEDLFNSRIEDIRAYTQTGTHQMEDPEAKTAEEREVMDQAVDGGLEKPNLIYKAKENSKGKTTLKV